MSKQKTSMTGGLIPLPRDYTDLMNLAAAFTCPNNVSGPSAGEVGGRKFFNSKLFSSFSKGEKSGIVPHLRNDGLQPERVL